MSKERKAVASGIGESKTFNAAPGTFAERPVRHAGGRPVGTGMLDHLLASQHSDEQIAENEKKPKAQVTVTRGPLDKAIEERRDFRLNEMEPWMAPDPAASLASQYTPEGHIPRFISADNIAKGNMRGWKTVITADGDPVKLGGQILASMPKDRAAIRNQYFRAKGNERLAEIYDTHRASQEQIDRAVRGRDSRPASGDIGLQRDYPALD